MSVELIVLFSIQFPKKDTLSSDFYLTRGVYLPLQVNIHPVIVSCRSGACTEYSNEVLLHWVSVCGYMGMLKHC